MVWCGVVWCVFALFLKHTSVRTHDTQEKKQRLAACGRSLRVHIRFCGWGGGGVRKCNGFPKGELHLPALGLRWWRPALVPATSVEPGIGDCLAGWLRQACICSVGSPAELAGRFTDAWLVHGSTFPLRRNPCPRYRFWPVLASTCPGGTVRLRNVAPLCTFRVAVGGSRINVPSPFGEAYSCMAVSFTLAACGRLE